MRAARSRWNRNSGSKQQTRGRPRVAPPPLSLLVCGNPVQAIARRSLIPDVISLTILFGWQLVVACRSYLPTARLDSWVSQDGAMSICAFRNDS